MHTVNGSYQTLLIIVVLGIVSSIPAGSLISHVGFESQETVPAGFGKWPRIVPPTGHTSYVTSLAFSADGKFILSSSEDWSVLLWDIAIQRPVQRFKGHRGGVSSVAFSPDGEHIISGSWDKTIRTWNLKTGQEVRSFTLRVPKLAGRSAGGQIHSVAISPDGRYILCGSKSGIYLLEAESGIQVRQFSPGGLLRRWLYTDIWSVAFSPDGQYALGGYWGGMYLWKLESGRVVHHFKNKKKRISSVVFSSDGQYILSGSEDSTVRVWSVLTGKELFRLEGHTGPVLSVAISSSGRLALSGSEDHTIRVWDLEKREQIGSFKGFVEGKVNAVAFSSDETQIAYGGFISVLVRRLPGQTDNVRYLISSFLGAPSAVALSPDGRHLASGLLRGIRLWDMESGFEVRRFEGHTSWVESLAFSDDGEYLLSGSGDKTMRLWEVASGRELITSGEHGGTVKAVAFSPDGRFALSASDEGIWIWDLTKKPLEARRLRRWGLAALSSDVFTAVFSPPDGRYVIGGFLDPSGGIRIWDATTGKSVRTLGGPILTRGTFTGHKKRITSLVVSSDGKHILSGSWDKTMRWWDVETGDELFRLRDKEGPINHVRLTPDDKYALSISPYAMRLWDMATRQEVGRFRGHWGNIESAEFTSDGSVLVSISDDGTHRYWDVSTREELVAYVSTSQGEWLAYTPDGLFDGTPGAWNQVLWRFDQDTFDVAPVEIFFSEFYYPGLLADILAGKRPKAPRSIAEVDRRQPRVEIEMVDVSTLSSYQAKGDRSVTLKLKVDEASADEEYAQGSGARDVRLFRNGLLVKVWHGEVMPQGGGSVNLEAIVPIVAGENRFTAYAFNHDNIKSTDASFVINGADWLKRTGTPYILAIGIKEYTNPDYQLGYAGDDAEAFAKELKDQLDSLGTFAEAKIIRLLNEDATKANILKALSIFAGEEVGAAPAVLRDVGIALPEDVVVVFFSGHGTAQQDRYYLIPHDMGYTGPRTGLDEAGLNTLLAHSISDQELEQVFEKIDARQLLLILDACNSGQALEAEEKRRGPMNSKGLVQLGYEKGMNILTASQSYQVARETSELGHGFLTHALVEGLKTTAADKSPQDDQVTVTEWLDYATGRVPQIHTQIHAKKHEIAERIRRLRTPDRRVLTKKAEEQLNKKRVEDVQRPRVFYRREPASRPLIVAKPTSTEISNQPPHLK